MAGLLSAQRAPSGSALDQIRPELILAHMTVLADDRLEGRGPGTPGHELAERYVAGELAALSLEPAFGDRYVQSVPLRRADAIDGDTRLTFTREGREMRLSHARDFVIDGDAYRTDALIAGPVAFAGYGIAAAELGYDDYTGIDVRGKVVAFVPGVPAALHAAGREYFGALDVRMEAAIARGAVGLLFLAPDAAFPWEAAVALARQGTTTWLDVEQAPSRPSAPLAVAVLTPAASHALFGMASRDLTQTAARLAGGERQSFDMGVAASLRSRSRHTLLKSGNVGAILRGSDPRLAGEYVVFTAHLDHLGRGEPVHGDDIYNGAVDNASGVAALLAVARAFASGPEAPRRSVLFLAPTAEESGAVGSDYFMAHSPVPVQAMVASINIDAPTPMLYPLYSVTAMGAVHSSLGPLAEDAARELGLIVRSAPLAMRSDSPPFLRRGVPVLRVVTSTETGRDDLDGEQLARDWMAGVHHTPRDDMRQRLDVAAVAAHARMNFLIGHRVAQDATRPRWNAGDFFGERFGR